MDECALSTHTNQLFHVDSGATSHCSPERSDFSELRAIPTCLIGGINGTSIAAIGQGRIIIRCGKGRKLTLTNVLYVPQATLHLISIGRLANNNILSSFTSDGCILCKGPKVIVNAKRSQKGLYSLTTQDIRMEHANIACAIPDLETWHKRLGHISYDAVIKMAKKWLTTGMLINMSTLPPLCESCILSKQAKVAMPRHREGRRVTRLLEKVHSDITGPEDVRTPTRDLYTLNFLDDFSQNNWVYAIRHKSEAITKFQEWKALVETETGHQVKIYCTDNGGEFTSRRFKDYLHTTGVRHEVTTPYTSAHNGKAERNHRTILSRARAIMADCKFPPTLWGECVQTVAYLKYCMPTCTLKDKTPYEMYYGQKPVLSHLCKIGCKAFMLIQSKDRPKIYNRSVECVLVGYSANSKAFRCWNKQTGCIIVSRNIHFIETKDVKSHPLHYEHSTLGVGSEDEDDEHPIPSTHLHETCTLTPQADTHLAPDPPQTQW